VLLTFGSPLLQLLIAARTSPAVAILLFGIAAALYAASKRRAATIPAAAALLYALIGTHMFASMTSSDPLFSNHQATWIAPPRPIVSREVGSMAGVLRLSPDARSFAVGSIGDDEEESLPEKFTVGRIDGPLTEIDASDVAFLHSEAILRLKATDESARVDTVTTTGVSGAWHVETLPVWSPHLEAKANGEWILSGTSIAQARELVVRGRIGSPALAQLPRPMGTVYATVTGSERMPEWMYVISQMRGGTEFRRTATPLDQTVGSTILGFGQTFEMPDTHQWVVVAHDKTSTYAGILDEHENHVRPAGVVNERSHHVAAGRGSRLALNSASAAVVWNLRTNKAMRLSCPTCVVLDVALADRVAGVLWMRGGAVSVALFPTDVLE